MKLSSRTILITGGGSGIGRALAEELNRRGNKVIVAGRRQAALDEVAAANPGIETVVLDVADQASITAAANDVLARFPELDVVVNNAGIMLFDDASTAIDEELLTSQIETNLLGSIRVTGAFIEHLKTRPDAAVLYNTSTLAFVPIALFATYSATKAALHSFVLSQRFRLAETSVKVFELAPPWVATGLVGEPDDERAMPLDAFVSEALELWEQGDKEIVVQPARVHRDNPGPDEHGFIDELNRFMVGEFAG